MAILAVSFRIADIGNRHDRWASLVAAIKRESPATDWDETTSFLLIASHRSAEDFANSVYLGSAMSITDLLLVIDLSTKHYAVRGDCRYPNTLAALMMAR
jgi:hypothetical protein